MTPKQHINKLAFDALQAKHPTWHPDNIPKPSYSDKTANALTKMVIDWINLNGGRADRISSSGRYLDNSKVVVNSMGQSRKIGSGKFIPGQTRKGYADVNCTIRGFSVMVEIKMKDRQSEHQKKFEELEKKAGGQYWLVHNFDEFYNYYNEFIKKIEGIVI